MGAFLQLPDTLPWDVMRMWLLKSKIGQAQFKYSRPAGDLTAAISLTRIRG